MAESDGIGKSRSNDFTRTNDNRDCSSRPRRFQARFRVNFQCVVRASTCMRTIILFARAPQRGRVKTRLAREIGEDAALGIYVAMLRDSLDKAARLAKIIEGEAIVAYTPHDALEIPAGDGAPSLRELWSGSSWPQPAGDLGARMHGAIEWAFGRGASAVALLGADVPDMSLSTLSANFRILSEEFGRLDVMLEPARDGGFWTLLCSRALPQEAFDVDWNQDATCEPLRANLEALGLRVRVASRLGEDVDDLAALQRLARRLRPKPPEAPRTFEWLRKNGWA